MTTGHVFLQPPLHFYFVFFVGATHSVAEGLFLALICQGHPGSAQRTDPMDARIEPESVIYKVNAIPSVLSPTPPITLGLGLSLQSPAFCSPSGSAGCSFLSPVLRWSLRCLLSSLPLLPQQVLLPNADFCSHRIQAWSSGKNSLLGKGELEHGP